MDLRLTSFEDIDALMNIVATCVPIALAVLSGAFGLRASRQEAPSSGSDITVVRLVDRPEPPTAATRRRRYQYAELSLGILVCIGFVYYVIRQGSLIPNPTTTRAEIANSVYDVGRWSAAIMYLLLIPVYVRTLFMLWRTPLGTQPWACAAAEIVVAAPRNAVGQRCQSALRRMRTSITEIDLEKGNIEARKHYLFNLYKPYFDQINIRLERVADDEYRLFLQSDGIIPTFRRDKQRNEANVQRLIGYITR